MIHRQFIHPNFRCTVQINAKKKRVYILYAENEEKARKKLRDREGYTKKDGEQYPEITVQPYDFNRWLQRASRAKEDVLAAIAVSKPPVFTESLWKQLKYHLFDLFDGKCAFCESDFSATSPGEVEHFRPKGKVEEEKKHLGYYWLAYEPENLLPSCKNCNNIKRDHFPVKTTRVRNHMEKIESEDPLLLHPYTLSEPEKHFSFVLEDPDFGFIGENKDAGSPDASESLLSKKVCVMKSNSKQGEATIKLYDLNRHELCISRGACCHSQLSDLKNFFLSDMDRFDEILARIANGKVQYSAALHHICMNVFHKLQTSRMKLNEPGNL